ncbi:E3 ubiquitin-protein ligase TRIM39-like [Lissotriton helveticus]
MAAGGTERNLQEELTCSVCLGYFADPVFTECGHIFCRACISRCEQGAGGAGAAELPRPEKEPAEAAARMEALRLEAARLPRREREAAELEAQMEALRLDAAAACCPDKEAARAPRPEPGATQLLCPECRRSFTEGSLRPIRRMQSIVPLVKDLLRQPLVVRGLCGEHNERARHFCREEEELICPLCTISAAHRPHDVVVLAEAYEEYKADLQDWLEIMKKEAEKLEESKKRKEGLTGGMRPGRTEKIKLKQISNLMTEIETKCQQPAEELLKDIRTTLNRFGHFTSLVTKRFAQKYKALVTLDPDTVRGELSVSEDGRRATGTGIWTLRPVPTPANPRIFSRSPAVLGREGFTSGRHYWEVHVLQEEWEAVGVAGEFLDTGSFTVEFPVDRVCYVNQWDGDWYRALSISPSPEAPQPPPQKLGLYLDYEGGRFSLYNTDTWKHLCTCNGTFTEGVHPLFLVAAGEDMRLV